MSRRGAIIGIMISVACAGTLAVVVLGTGARRLGTPAGPGPASVPGYVGTLVCASCHTAEAKAWRGSQHDRAMQPATPETVLGDFGGVSVKHFGAKAVFMRHGNRFFVRTEGPGGKMREFRVAYVLGVYPLQQLLIAMPGGRLQAFGIAWDARPKTAGGQHWFTLYPDERIRPGDPLHWTSRNQTWNWMCASCHSTALRRGYDSASDSYATTWAAIDVGCEACHGPGADHVAWVRAGAHWDATPDAGLKVRLSRGGFWQMSGPRPGIAELKGADAANGAAQIGTCAACHSRRRPLVDAHQAGTPFLDDFVPALLDEGLYHANGQINGEVYVWGSFVQSRMYRAGVVCSDCHEPHSATLRARGNTLCARCHMPERFDRTAHTHHKAGSKAAQCITCHMPVKTYMVIDPRRDHSFRLPRPDLAARLGTPDVCTGCHKDRNPTWAAAAIDNWFGPERPKRSHFAAAIARGRSGTPGAWTDLADLAKDRRQPAIARATALSLLPRYASWLDPVTIDAIIRSLGDDEPLVRLEATAALSVLPLNQTAPALFARLKDRVRAVRIEAARQLAAVPPGAVPGGTKKAFDKAVAELETSLAASGERPETLVNRANLEAARRRPEAAEAAYRRAIEIDPTYAPAYVNLAELLRGQNGEDAAQRVLRDAIEAIPDAAAAHHALGLSLVRTRHYTDALAELRRAWELAPDNSRFGYVYGVALDSVKKRDKAVKVLASVVKRHPTDRAACEALIGVLIREGKLKAARGHLSALAKMAPGDKALQSLLARLGPPKP